MQNIRPASQRIQSVSVREIIVIDLNNHTKHKYSEGQNTKVTADTYLLTYSMEQSPS